jgi:hypothetical protein
VDDIVRLVKAGAVPFPNSDRIQAEQARDTNTGDRQPMIDGLKRVAGLLERLADTLLADEDTLAAHGEEIQNLDICNQTIEAVIHALSNHSPGNCQRLESLGVSCDRALAKDRRG